MWNLCVNALSTLVDNLCVFASFISLHERKETNQRNALAEPACSEKSGRSTAKLLNRSAAARRQ